LQVDAAVCETIVDLLNKRYGVETALTVTQGDLYDYISMALDYSTEGKGSVRMEDYVENMLKDLPGCFDGLAITPAANCLFKVNERVDALNKEDLYHSITPKKCFSASGQDRTCRHPLHFCVQE
jgi:hypothetical protein